MPKATEPMGCRKQIFGRLKFIGTYSLQPSSTERECEGQPGGVGVCARVRSAAMFVQGALESMSARCTARCLALTFVDPRKCHSLLFSGSGARCEAQGRIVLQLTQFTQFGNSSVVSTSRRPVRPARVLPKSPPWPGQVKQIMDTHMSVIHHPCGMERTLLQSGWIKEET